MSSTDKLNILLALIFLGVCFIALLITMRSIGNIEHSLARLQEIIKKEIKITYRNQVRGLYKEQQRESIKKDRQRRQKALLNVPLMENRPTPPKPPKDSN